MSYSYDDFQKEFTIKLDKLIDKKYEKETKRIRRKKFCAEYYDKYYESIDFAIKNWYRKKNATLPPLYTLLNLCNFFDCDIEYFITKQKFFSKNIYDISKIIGLDYTTIDELTHLSISEKHIVDAIFGRTIISTNLIKTIQEMLYYSHPIAKNRAYIKLDKELTARDNGYEELERELNENEVIDILSYKLSFEMRKIIESLSKDDKLSSEISQDYNNKFFKKHKKILAVNELPKFTTDDKGNVIIDIDAEIYRIEQKILNRLEKRDKKGKIFDYGIDHLHNYSDFSKIIKQYRTEKTKQDYLSWLNLIDDETE